MQYIGIRSEGGLIPYDILDSIANEEAGLGQQAKDFGLAAGRRLTDEIARAWSDAQDYWHIFQRRSASLPESETGTTLTRKWVTDLLNDLLGYELTYHPSGAVILGKNYPISHRAGAGEESPPVHVEGLRIDLDRRPQGRRLSPQALVQEYLNNSEGHLWGIVTNGVLLRLLRDTSRTSRPTYLEFDLQSILDGNRFNEFALFYRVCHRSRLPKTAEDSTSCWLEKSFQLSIEQGGRVREKLRVGVEDALKTLGTGLLRHPDNTALRERVKSGALSPAEFHRQLLRLVYRLLFLMVAEERRMIVPEAPDSERRQRLYDTYYGVGRLRNLAEKYIEPSTFGDLWIGLQQTFALFEDGADSNPLGIPPLNGALFSDTALPDIRMHFGDKGDPIGPFLHNTDLLKAIYRLSLFEDHRVLQRVNYGALDVEELGSVYESLLDYQPVSIEDTDGFRFDLRAGSERKSTGSYYTRPELVRELIESALVPVMQDRLNAVKDADPTKQKEKQQQAILSMTVCDPACGSGHFLLAAARRLGRELAKVRTGEDEPTPKEFHLAVRDVIAHCIYGVDVNPLAVDLCKLALWLEGHWTGKPLSFLDHRIKCGNSLIGVLDPKVLEEGVPDDAFNPVTGDDKEVAKAFKRRNRDERRGQPSLPFDVVTHTHGYATEYHKLTGIVEDTPAGVREKAKAYQAWRGRKDWWHDWAACNIWTAAFFTPLTKVDDSTVPTHERLLRFVQRQDSQPQMAGSANALAEKLRFFHWHLEFPEVFERSGFDVVLGNPPWDKIQVEEQPFFASRDPQIAAATGAARKRLIQKLEAERPELFKEFAAHRRAVEVLDDFIKSSGRFPLTGLGKMNMYASFSEAGFRVLHERGRCGILVPLGIATDDNNKDFFSALVSEQRLVSLLGFENEDAIFPAVHHSFKFAALTFAGASSRSKEKEFALFCLNFSDLLDHRRRYVLTDEEIKAFNPNTATLTLFRTSADAEVNKRLYRSTGVLSDDGTDKNEWQVSIHRMFNPTDDSDLFKTRAQLESEGFILHGNALVKTGHVQFLPVYEAKMMHQFDHRFGTYDGQTQQQANQKKLPELSEEQHRNATLLPSPTHWVSAHYVDEFIGDHTDRQWLFTYRDITSAVVFRTAIAAIVPRTATVDPCRVIYFGKNTSPARVACFLGCFNSLPLDYLARQKVSWNHLAIFVLKQLPMLGTHVFGVPEQQFIVPRVLELTYTAWDILPFAEDIWREADEHLRRILATQKAASDEDVGSRCEKRPSWASTPEYLETPAPFGWSDKRRVMLRAELDAYYAHLYGLTREELRYILDPKDVFGDDFPSETFRVLKEREEKEYGEYRTRRLVLEAFDKLAESPRFRGEIAKRVSAFENSKAVAKVTAS